MSHTNNKIVEPVTYMHIAAQRNIIASIYFIGKHLQLQPGYVSQRKDRNVIGIFHQRRHLFNNQRKRFWKLVRFHGYSNKHG